MSGQSRPADVAAPNRPLPMLLRALFWLAYRLDLARNRVLRPRTRGAYVAIWLNDELLLIRNSYKGVLTLPCGMIKSGELPCAAAARELHEEVGISVDCDALEPSFETLSLSEYKRDQIQVFDLRLTQPPLLRLDGQEVVWAGFRSVDEALMLPLHAPVKDYLLHRQPLAKAVPAQVGATPELLRRAERAQGPG